MAYNDFLRSLAKEKHCLLADLNADMQAAIAEVGPEKKKGNLLTSDGVHMNPAGNKMMATGVLKAFGLSAEQMAQAQMSWVAPAPAAGCRAHQNWSVPDWDARWTFGLGPLWSFQPKN